MNKKHDKIITAPILSLSAKIELFAKFLRKATTPDSPALKKVSSSKGDTPLRKTIKKIASKEIQTAPTSQKKKETA